MDISVCASEFCVAPAMFLALWIPHGAFPTLVFHMLLFLFLFASVLYVIMLYRGMCYPTKKYKGALGVSDPY